LSTTFNFPSNDAGDAILLLGHFECG
jgi:hypothetical protein